MDELDLSPTQGGIQAHTVVMLVVFYTIACAAGAIAALSYSAGASFAVTVVGAVNLGVWAVLDARRRRRPIPLLAQPWFVILAGLLVPIYTIYSRRFRGLAWVVVHAIGMYATQNAAFAATVATAYGPETLRSVEWF